MAGKIFWISDRHFVDITSLSENHLIELFLYGGLGEEVGLYRW